MKAWLAALGLLLAALGGAARADEQVLRFYGYAYDLKTNRYLYTEAHRQRLRDGHWIDGAVRYYDPDGHLIGSKTLDFSADPFVPVYRLDLPQSGYFEAITAVGERIEMAKREKSGAAVKTASVPRTPPICGDAGFHACIYAHFAELMAGQTLNFSFAVAGNLDVYKFRARRDGEAEFEGRKLVRLRLEPDSVLRWFVDPLEALYDPDGRRLVEYRGVSNLHDPRHGKPYTVRIAYYREPPPDLPVLPPATP